jgi:hypothetical protein
MYLLKNYKLRLIIKIIVIWRLVGGIMLILLRFSKIRGISIMAVLLRIRIITIIYIPIITNHKLK